MNRERAGEQRPGRRAGRRRPRRAATRLQVDVQRNADASGVPADETLRSWAGAALGERPEAAELTIRIVDAAESRSLNRRYRGRDRPTNVLSFPADLPAGLGLPLLGDLVVCAAVIEREAGEQAKPLDAHWAHVIVHGVLHLLGYDHEQPQQARSMEAREIRVLAELGYANPYE